MTLYRRSNSCYCFGCRRHLNTIDVLMQFYAKSYTEALDYLLGDCLGSPVQLLRRRVKAHFEELHRKRQYQKERSSVASRQGNTEQKTTVQSLDDVVGKSGRAELPTLGGLLCFPGSKEQGEQADPTLEIRSRGEEVTAILSASAEFYHLMLAGNEQARTYLTKRGLSDATINRYRLGYAGGVGLRAWLRTHRLDLSLAVTLGLLGRDSHSECLTGRVILPVFDQSGKIVGMTGRYLSERAEVYGEWLNPDTGQAEAESFPMPSGTEEDGAATVTAEQDRAVKQSSKYLHLRLPKPAFERFLPLEGVVEEVLLVEGIFDYLIAVQWGYRAIPAFGTGVTTENISFVKTVLEQGRVRRLLVCFDNDPDRLLPDGTHEPGAGPRATAELIASLGLGSPPVRAVKLPDGIKDIGNLGEIPDGAGQALLAQAIKQALSSQFPSA